MSLSRPSGKKIPSQYWIFLLLVERFSVVTNNCKELQPKPNRSLFIHFVNYTSVSQVIYSDVERKFNKDITIGLIRFELLNLAEYNLHLAKLIDGGRNSMYFGNFTLGSVTLFYAIK